MTFDPVAFAAYQVFDESGAMERVDGDRGLLKELFDLFFTDAEARLIELQSTAGSGNGPDLQAKAHSIKSALGNIGAQRAAQVAAYLERRGKESQFADAPSAATYLRESVAAFRAATEAWRTRG